MDMYQKMSFASQESMLETIQALCSGEGARWIGQQARHLRGKLEGRSDFSRETERSVQGGGSGQRVCLLGSEPPFDPEGANRLSKQCGVPYPFGYGLFYVNKAAVRPAIYVPFPTQCAAGVRRRRTGRGRRAGSGDAGRRQTCAPLLRRSRSSFFSSPQRADGRFKPAISPEFPSRLFVVQSRCHAASGPVRPGAAGFFPPNFKFSGKNPASCLAICVRLHYNSTISPQMSGISL